MQNITRNCNSRVSGRKGDFPASSQEMLGGGILLPQNQEYLQGAPALLGTYRSPRASSVPWPVLLPVLGEVLLSTCSSGFPYNLLPRLPPSPSLRQFAFSTSGATTRKRRASDSESSVCRIHSQTVGVNGPSQQSQVASGRGARDSCCLSGPGSGLGSVPS